MSNWDAARVLQQTARGYWDQAAATFDEALDHGLREASVREAWADLLRTWLPRPPAAALATLPKTLGSAAFEELSSRAEMCGGAVADERYLIVVAMKAKPDWAKAP
ncbi:MAG: hypothetical protein IT318_15945 [Anaerolineales bacterium]|nr:hypothetical protein [Anaerolineales bacterium]